MKHISYWMDTSKAPVLPTLDGDKTCEVAIVGAGITGITTALLLSLKGIKTLIIDADKAGSGTTGRTTAKITVQHGLKYQHLDFEKAQSYLKANQAGLKLIERFVNDYGIECSFEYVPSYVYTLEQEEVKLIEKEMEVCEKLGLNCELVHKTELPFDIIRAIKVDNQACFHPLKYLYSLIDILIKNGSVVYEHAKVVDIEKDDPVILHTDKGSIRANKVVLATNYPLVEFPGSFFLRLHQERSYIVCAECEGKPIKGMYINAGRPVNSVRTHSCKDRDILMLGGYGHKTGSEDDNEQESYESLLKLLHKDFNKAEEDPLYGWSAQDSVTLDNIPYVGSLSNTYNNIYVASGYAKWGMTNSAAAAMILTDLITGSTMIDEDVKDVFDPLRFEPGASAKNFFAQTANTVKRFTAGNVLMPLGEYDDILPGKGAVLRINGVAQAVYKNKDGKVTVFEAHCTHMKCPLEYNEGENSFDCGCHGSRFAMDGSVLEGPAKKALKRIDEDGE